MKALKHADALGAGTLFVKQAEDFFFAQSA
jgi:hypothetical protein